MNNLSILKNRLIDRIMISQNEGLLAAIEGVLNSAGFRKKCELYPKQFQMLCLNEMDIAKGDLLSEEELKRIDSE